MAGPSRLQCFFIMMKKRLQLHKMDDWKRYRLDLYAHFIRNAQSGLEERRIALRVQNNAWGIYENPKTYENGVAYNDGTWLIYTTSRMSRDVNGIIYKDKVFCKDKKQLIDDLYNYILFLRKLGVEVVYEMNFYAVAFLTKYLRFYDKVFDCTIENKKKVGELCQAAFNKDPEEIDCCTRIDPRKFALDPYEIKRMTKGMTKRQTTAEITRFQKRIQKQMTDDLIRKWYDPNLSVRKNIEVLKVHGIEISVGRMQQWVKENVLDQSVRYGFQN